MGNVQRWIIPILAVLLVAGFSEALAEQQHATRESHGGEAVHDAIFEEGHGEAGNAHGSEALGKSLPLWTMAPFVGILLSIALLPLFAPHFWHRHFGRISAGWALAFSIPFLIVFKGEALHEILHIYLVDYIPFIILLWALFTVSGGIHVGGSLRGTPLLNTILILIGTVLASWMGTTGASMVMIRPLLRANRERKHKVHIVCFFIFLVSNIGGSLTPLGDPPLFLGFLHGVPFFWTFSLLPHMVLMVVALLIVFFIVDTRYYRRDKDMQEATAGEKQPIRIEGLYNLLFLGGVVAGVLMSGMWRPGTGTSIYGIDIPTQNLVRDLLLILMGFLSLRVTPRRIRSANEFTWFPIKEVAYLFAGIFMTIIPALAILRAGSEGSLAFLLDAVKEPVHYFWVTGVLSSFLDNAPTYLTFFNSALGRFFPGTAESVAVGQLIAEQSIFLKAISAGAVFMGANTYIGNAPNFMVRSIAEESGVPMPSFFGYMIRYSIPFLVPLYLVVAFVFFR
ncbi:MAG: sodium:proton antiporter [Candidatus Eisenbacteria sp.]|nr:sodium:proton antiporter [Candidatus Eisenbacteria bacterium]